MRESVTPRWRAPKERYVSLVPLSSGGMGSVEIALREDAEFARVVAIKRLHPHLLADEAFVSMFVDEARIAAMIRHANVVGVLDVGSDERGPYFVMDYIEGLSLSKVLVHHTHRSELIPLQVCLRIAKQVCDGLHAAHELRASDGTELLLVHRDVSPQNVLVGFDGTVRVLDFGVAKAVGRLTQTAMGTVKGKYGYMAPEQLQYESLDRRADLFSLGVVFYEMLSGQRLYGGDSHEVAKRILHEPPPDPTEARTDLPDALIELVFELLAKDRDLRPRTALEVSHRLDALVADCVAEEGSLDLSDYVRHAFSTQIEVQRTELEAALQTRSGVVQARTHGQPTPLDIEPLTVVLPGSSEAGLARRLRWPLVSAGAALVVVGASTLAWTRSPPPLHARASRIDRAAAVEPAIVATVSASAPSAPETPNKPRSAPTRSHAKSAASAGMPMWKWKP